jgi:(E)-2-((N-methylformamido)methylene)succinate hydrolase
MATAFDIQGPVDAPAVVLIHGLGLNRAMWQWLVPVLAGSFRVVSYDLLGHGQSGPPPPAPNLSTLGAQVVRLMDDLALPRAALVGFSLGGMVARRVAQDHPARVTALCLLNTPHTRSPDAQAAVVARVTEARQNGPAATVEAALARWFSDDFRAKNPAMMDLVRQWVLANDPAIYPDLYAIFATGVAEVVAPTPPLTCPTLVITGDEDFGNSPAMAHAIAAEISGAEVTILPGLRHMALAEDPERTNALVLAFLSRVLINRGTP